MVFRNFLQKSRVNGSFEDSFEFKERFARYVRDEIVLALMHLRMHIYVYIYIECVCEQVGEWWNFELKDREW